MFVPSKYQFVVSSIADVPVQALVPHGKFGVVAVPPQIAEKLGGSVSDLFPDFARNFPLTVASMEKHWSKPTLAVKDMGGDWLANLFLEQRSHNLFMNKPYPIYASDPDFEVVVVRMLPLQWVGLYRSMESFNITSESSHSPLGWRNTPMPRSMDIDRFSTETNIKKAKLKAFEKQLGVTQERKLRCWMLTDAHDSLWIDEQHCDKKVHHVHADAFADAYVLPDPGALLDQYLAHVVAGGQPQDFNFRR